MSFSKYHSFRSDISTCPNYRMGFKHSMAFIGYGERWRTYKRISHRAMSITAVQMYYDMQERETRRLVMSLLQDPGSYRKQIQLWAYYLNICEYREDFLMSPSTLGRIIMDAMYGIDCPTPDDTVRFSSLPHRRWHGWRNRKVHQSRRRNSWKHSVCCYSWIFCSGYRALVCVFSLVWSPKWYYYWWIGSEILTIYWSPFPKTCEDWPWTTEPYGSKAIPTCSSHKSKFAVR